MSQLSVLQIKFLTSFSGSIFFASFFIWLFIHQLLLSYVNSLGSEFTLTTFLCPFCPLELTFWNKPKSVECLYLHPENEARDLKTVLQVCALHCTDGNAEKKQVDMSGPPVFEWVNEWVKEWMSEWVNEWMSEWVNEWMSEWRSEWVNEGNIICSQRRLWHNTLKTTSFSVVHFEWVSEWMYAWVS